MQTRFLPIVAATAALLATTALAADIDELSKKSGCSGCHATATKKMGPSMQDLGKKFKCDSAKFVSALQAGGVHKSVVAKADMADIKALADQLTK